ncbi:hypothetical protein ACOMHN_035198 [Nucella lapillus]
MADIERVENYLEKAVDVHVDIGNLLALDVNEIASKEFRKQKEQFLLNISRDNVQVLVNSLNQLPTEQKDGITIAKLPEPTTVLPREKPVPKAKQATKWEQFARLKGIQNKKKQRMLWDEESQQYKPRWGYKRKDETKSWLLEVPDKADPMEDQFEKVKMAKKKRIAKNELQRLRNIARGIRSKVPGVGLTPTAAPSKQQLQTSLAVTHKATASLGKFMDTLPKEKIRQGKRKFDSNDIGAGEKERQKKIMKKVLESRPVIDVNRAANVSQQNEERQRAASKKDGDGEKKKKKAGDGQRRKKAGGKTFGGKGGKKMGGKGPGGKGGKQFGGKGKKSGGKKGSSR